MDTMTMADPTRARAFDPRQAERVGTSTMTPGWDLETERRIDDGRTLANALGWFSLALGAAELVAPGKIAGWLGMDEAAPILQAYGVREIGTGAGILKNRRPAEWVWGRVAGDFLDLATLAPGLRSDNPNRKNVVTAMAAVAGVTVLDILCARQLSASRR